MSQEAKTFTESQLPPFTHFHTFLQIFQQQTNSSRRQNITIVIRNYLPSNLLRAGHFSNNLRESEIKDIRCQMKRQKNS